MPLLGDAKEESVELSEVDGHVEPPPMSATGTAETSHPSVRAEAAPERLGERLRQLRVAAGMTQTDLAGGRFSKEYMSQIERGKTRPTAETVRWLAERLAVDPSLLASGISSAERAPF